VVNFHLIWGTLVNKIITVASAVAIALSCSGLAHAKNDKEKNKNLPYGLQKKVQSGKSLPPGWQKKLSVGNKLDDDVYEQGKIVVKDSDKGLITVTVEGKLIKVIENTREIVEILDGV